MIQVTILITSSLSHFEHYEKKTVYPKAAEILDIAGEDGVAADGDGHVVDGSDEFRPQCSERAVYTGDKTFHVCRYRQRWRFEKMGEFLLKLHR
jgi:hypothetical protein